MFSSDREVGGRSLPHRWTIRLGDEVFADLTIDSYGFGKGKEVVNEK
jgi:hypothetical protein